VPRLAVVTAVLGLAIAAAPADAHRRAVSFQGSCSLSGTVFQDPPITTVPAPGSAVARAAGTCSGTLTDRRGRSHQLDAARATYAASASGTVGCSGGTATGRGKLRLAGRTLRFRFSEARGPGVAAIRLEGRRSGSAAGQAVASASADPVAIALACAGPGLASVPIDITLATTPAIAG
jgi:hypothetical protein